MKVYVYADESGTFDKTHNELFVYGGIVVPGKEAKDELERRYLAVEDSIKSEPGSIDAGDEAKACRLSMKERKRLFRVVEKSRCRQFGYIVQQGKLKDAVFATKATRQRYLDWALKMGIKLCVNSMFKDGSLLKSDVDKLAVFVDEHSSSTAGKYNLCESINEEFRTGIYNPETNTEFAPVFSPDFPKIPVGYLNSEKTTLIRAADVTANWIYCAERDKSNGETEIARLENSVSLHRHP